MQEKRNSSALAMDLRLSCINPSKWWRHDTETLDILLALCEGDPHVAGGFPSQRGQ